MDPRTAGFAEGMGWLVDLTPYLAAPLGVLLLGEIVVLLAACISIRRDR